jgi:hypothetical protein
MCNQIYLKIAGYVDLDMLNMSAVSTYHLSLIVFEIKDEKYNNIENLMKKGWSESSLGCLVSKLCPVMLCTNQHGRYYKK